MVNQNAAIYCRLSKEDMDKLNKGDDSESIQNQKLLLMDYATNQNFSIYKVYVDDDYSGLDKNRPSFKQMIRDAEKGLFDIVICKNQSRFTRDMELVEKYLHGLFVIWGIRFIGVTDNVDTNVKGNKKARQINGLINEWYCEDLSDNIRTVFKKKMESGQFLGPFACYGYERDPHNKHKIIIDDEAANVVREIFSLYMAGNGAVKIAQILTSRGVLTPSEYKVSKGLKFAHPNGIYGKQYGAWATNTIKKILGNETYIGSLIQGKERKVSYKSKKVVSVPKDEWIIVKNNHEPIIDEKTFSTVQHLIANKRTDRNIKIGSKTLKQPHLLAGKVKCLDCGNTMQRSGPTRDRLSFYLRCRVASKTKNAECTPHCTRQDKIELSIEQKIRELIEGVMKSSSSEIAEKFLSGINNTKNIKTLKQKQLAEIEGKIKDILKVITTSYADKVNGLITEEEFISFKESFEEEKQIYIKKKESLERELAEYEIRLKSQSNFSTLLEKYKSFDVLTHEVINNFVDYVQIGERSPNTAEQEIVINWLF